MTSLLLSNGVVATRFLHDCSQRHRTPKEDTFAKGEDMRHDPATARFRGALAVELRVQGMTYAEIADTLHYRHRSAARKAAMRTIRERADMAVDAYRVLRYLDLEDVQNASTVPVDAARPPPSM